MAERDQNAPSRSCTRACAKTPQGSKPFRDGAEPGLDAARIEGTRPIAARSFRRLPNHSHSLWFSAAVTIGVWTCARAWFQEDPQRGFLLIDRRQRRHPIHDSAMRRADLLR